MRVLKLKEMKQVKVKEPILMINEVVFKIVIVVRGIVDDLMVSEEEIDIGCIFY